MAEERPERAAGDGPSQPYRGPRAHDPEPSAPRPEDDPAYVTRTRFLSLVAVAGGVAITAAIVVPVIGFAVAPTLKPEPDQWVDVGPLRDFPDGATTSIAMSGPDPEADRRVFVRRRDNTIIPIWNRCAHLGCPVGYSPGGDVYACPCHGGAYDVEGNRTAGPPVRALDRYEYSIIDGSLWLGKLYAVAEVEGQGADAVAVRYRATDPGVHVDGLEQYLYPITP